MMHQVDQASRAGVAKLVRMTPVVRCALSARTGVSVQRVPAARVTRRTPARGGKATGAVAGPRSVSRKMMTKGKVPFRVATASADGLPSATTMMMRMIRKAPAGVQTAITGETVQWHAPATMTMGTRSSFRRRAGIAAVGVAAEERAALMGWPQMSRQTTGAGDPVPMT
jgi:hypothetical protein